MFTTLRQLAPTMPPEFKLHRDHKKIRDLRIKGITDCTFKCKRCKYLGWSKNGGEKKHMAMNAYCKSLNQNQQNNDPNPLVLPASQVELESIKLLTTHCSCD
jgi:hypothetical protein